MTDEFDTLRHALKSLPQAQAGSRDAAVALAMKNFDALQESAAGPRFNQDRPNGAGLLNGVRNMLKSLISRPVLVTTSSALALFVGLAVVLPLTNRPILTADPQAEQGRDEEPLTTADGAVRPDDQPAGDQPAVETRTEPAPTPSPSPTVTAAPNQLADTEFELTMKAEMDDGMSVGAVGMVNETAQFAIENTEEFSSAPANAVKVTVEEPVSTFSVDVDTASYSVIRSSLSNGFLPDPQSVRIEEMVNYFPYAYLAPDATGAPFRPTVSVMQTPWNPGTRLVHIALQGRLPAIENRPPLNLVFLIDTSGSMDEPNKLPLLKQSLRLMLGQLRPTDQIAIVAYAGSAGQVLEPTFASDMTAILAALDRLAAGGSTAGAEGLELAYDIAKAMSENGEVSRVLLATDGDFNVGVSDPEGLEAYVAKKRETGIYLSVLGFGRGNLDDATMQALAQNGNGQAGYIDTLNEAQKVLVDQLTGALFPIADDVKIQVEWNPAQVAEYRLIGYETRALAREDFNNDRVDAGEIGAGLQVTALYEVTAPGSSALRNDPLRYGDAVAGGSGELGFLRLRYKEPEQHTSALIEAPITEGGSSSNDARFAAAIAGFGQLLTGSVYLNDWGWDQAIALAQGARGTDDFGYRIEAINLMRLAQSLSGQQ